jgi:hypothetical protein
MKQLQQTLNHVLQDQAKIIDLIQNNNVVTKDNLHQYMQTVEKRIITKLNDNLTQTDLHNYMTSVEKNIIRTIKDNAYAPISPSLSRPKSRSMSVSTYRSNSSTRSNSNSNTIKCGRGIKCPNGTRCKRKKCIKHYNK